MAFGTRSCSSWWCIWFLWNVGLVYSLSLSPFPLAPLSIQLMAFRFGLVEKRCEYDNVCTLEPIIMSFCFVYPFLYRSVGPLDLYHNYRWSLYARSSLIRTLLDHLRPSISISRSPSVRVIHLPFARPTVSLVTLE